MEGLIEMEDVVGGRSDEEIEDLKEADDEQQYQRDWQDPESDDEIVLPAARLGRNDQKRRMTLTDVMQESQKR